MAIQTMNPTTGKALQTYQEMNVEAVDAIIDAAHEAHQQWSVTPFAKRAELLKVVALLLGVHKDAYAQLMAQEMGKPYLAGCAEIEKCQWVCQYFADHVDHLLTPNMGGHLGHKLAPHYIETDMRKSYVVYQPLGVIFAIMPWNFPFWQVFRFVAPNLMAGNTVLLSHAPITTGVALAIEKLFEEAESPKNLFHALVIDNDMAAHVIDHFKVRGVSLTGSVKAGRAVASAAGKALKKVVLELGGCDPYLILEDANLEQAAEACVISRMSNSGQVCIAAKRIIIIDSIKDEFEKLVLHKLERYIMGDPLDKTVNMGPLARADLRDTVHRQVQQCVQEGAELIMGGQLPEGPGFFYPPTLLKNVKPGMVAFEEEIFGPVIALINARNETEAIELANQSQFGLAAAVFTTDIARGEEIARDKIQAGTCYVNTFVVSDPRLPFGGILDSGYGRELGGEGIREFVNVKTVCIK